MDNNTTTVHTPYEDMLHYILDHGEAKEDRTNTGTRSVFGAQLRYDLSKGFPLITTKKVNFHAVVGELLWFLRGDTNIKFLQDNNVKIWNEWASDSGNLGPVYGAQWRQWYHVGENGYKLIVDDVPTKKDIPATRERFPEDVSYDNEPPHSRVAAARRESFVADCIIKSRAARTANSKDNADSPRVGEAVALSDDNIVAWWAEKFYDDNISPAWRNLDNFLQDLSTIPGYSYYVAHPNDYVLSTLYFGTSILSPTSAIFLPRWYEEELQHEEKKRPTVVYTNMDGHSYIMRRKVIHDQIADIVDMVRTQPDSRRIILNAWNVAAVGDMALPPCHTLFQLYVRGGKISGQLYQRSADMFLGVPFNIASYSLLIHMIARLTGYEVGEFVWTGGDCHIDDNHIEAVQEQLSRQPRDYPTLRFNNDPSTPLWDYDFSDIEVEGYNPHPFIKAPVAV